MVRSVQLSSHAVSLRASNRSSPSGVVSIHCSVEVTSFIVALRSFDLDLYPGAKERACAQTRRKRGWGRKSLLWREIFFSQKARPNGRDMDTDARAKVSEVSQRGGGGISS